MSGGYMIGGQTREYWFLRIASEPDGSRGIDELYAAILSEMVVKVATREAVANALAEFVREKGLSG